LCYKSVNNDKASSYAKAAYISCSYNVFPMRPCMISILAAGTQNFKVVVGVGVAVYTFNFIVNYVARWLSVIIRAAMIISDLILGYQL
jgi:hypothetical protein